MSADALHASLAASLAASQVPPQLHDGLVLYLVHHIQPGSFLLAVLENNLLGAVSRGDGDCQRELASIVLWLVNHAPGIAWGSPDQVAFWLTFGAKSQDGAMV